ncbi:MAG: DUF1566 domain-containing protein, partial [Spirochaetia bacterium]|nr:DUF1566 domain-containing protein [Spirochaetia bacterium]
DYRGGGHDDWFLPSLAELNQIYQNLCRNNLGGFSGVSYWSSSETSAKSAWFQSLYSGSHNHFYRSEYYRVRPVRAF